MLSWQYNNEQYNEENNSLINPGNYRVRIIDAKETIARNGNAGIEITLEVNGYTKKLKHFIWYNREHVERTNQRLGELFHSFDINEEERNSCESWLGKTGAVNVVHDIYKGHTIAKVAFCIKKDFQKNLKEWPKTEPEKPCYLDFIKNERITKYPVPQEIPNFPKSYTDFKF